MPLENATYIKDLNPDNPVGKSDFVSQGDDQIRMLKSVLQETLPNADAPYTGTVDETNNLTSGVKWVDNSATAGAASYFEVTDPTSTDDTKPDAPMVVGTPTVAQYNATPNLALTWQMLIDIKWPVGAYYESETDTRNPADILGFGTWEARTGLLYGVGTITDRSLTDSDGNALSLTIAAGAVQGRLYVTQANIATDTLTGSTGTPDDDGVMQDDGEHEHDYRETKDSGYFSSGGSTYGVQVGGSGETTGGGLHSHGVQVGIGEQTEPLLIPGYACYRWVRTA